MRCLCGRLDPLPYDQSASSLTLERESGGATRLLIGVVLVALVVWCTPQLYVVCIMSRPRSMTCAQPKLGANQDLGANQNLGANQDLGANHNLGANQNLVQAKILVQTKTLVQAKTWFKPKPWCKPTCALYMCGLLGFALPHFQG